jgi:hypothetical protein
MKRYAALPATLIFAAILSQITPAEAQNVPAPSGRYSIARHGSLVLGALLGEAPRQLVDPLCIAANNLQVFLRHHQPKE